MSLTESAIMDGGSLNKFTITVSNIKLTDLDSSKSDRTVVVYPSWPVPSDLVGRGLPSYLESLIKYLGNVNVSTTFTVSLSGQVGSFNCDCIYNIIVTVDDYRTGKAIVTAGPTKVWENPKGENAQKDANVNNAPLQATDPYVSPQRVIIQKRDTDNIAGCTWCVQEPDFKNVVMTIKAHVTLNFDNFCITTGQNYMHDDYCYAYFTQKLADDKGADAKTTTYLQDYCNRNYPNEQLDAFYNAPIPFDSKDYNICACNMPDSEYNDFKDSVIGSQPQFGPYHAKCLFSPCYSSVFKPIAIDGCPQPDCINVTAINDSTIDGPVEINQNISECTTLVQEDTTNTNTETTNNNTVQVPQTFMQKYGWIIILIAGLIFFGLLIIGGGFFAYSYTRKSTVSGSKVT